MLTTIKRVQQNNKLEQLKNVSLLGICGREGAGKTTIANILINSSNTNYEMKLIGGNLRPLDYIVDTIFGTNEQMNKGRDPIWNFSRLEQYDVIIGLITNYVDSNWIAKHNVAPFIAPFDILQSKKWVEFSFATALKKICSVIFQVPYKELLGQTVEDRKARETNLYGQGFDKLPDGKPMNGRVLLEYFGTDVMRNHFDKAVWINIVERESSYAIKQGFRVVFPDVRFENEIEMINKIDGTLLLVYRKEDDLILTYDDQKTHPAKWNFLQYYTNAKNLITFQNNLSLIELEAMIHHINESN
jgi:hypothetical protein